MAECEDGIVRGGMNQPFADGQGARRFNEGANRRGREILGGGADGRAAEKKAAAR